LPANPVATGHARRFKSWKNGVGYGFTGRQGWDTNSYISKQQEKSAKSVNLLNQVCDFLRRTDKTEITKEDVDLIQSTQLVKVMATFLRDASMLEMEKEFKTFECVFAVCTLLNQSALTRPLLYTHKEHKSLRLMCKEIYNFTKSSAELDGASVSSSASTAAADGSLTQIVMKVFPPIEEQYKESRKDKPKKEKKKEEKKSSGGDSKLDRAEKYVKSLSEHRFKYVDDLPNHHYAHQATAGKPSRELVKRLQAEYRDLSKSLPIHPNASIFMHVSSKNMQLARMVIIPASGPYQSGMFVFDVFFPSTYPQGPPQVNLMTTGSGSVGFNPNLYNCGKVCLSLLGTWSGIEGETWNPAVSTILQVAVSIMSLIFVDEPYYNEPGYMRQLGTPEGKNASNNYSANLRDATIKFAMRDHITKPALGFEYITQMHFFLQRDEIIKQIDGWLADGITSSSMKTSLTGLKDALKAQMEKLTEPAPPADEE